MFDTKKISHMLAVGEVVRVGDYMRIHESFHLIDHMNGTCRALNSPGADCGHGGHIVNLATYGTYYRGVNVGKRA